MIYSESSGVLQAIISEGPGDDEWDGLIVAEYRVRDGSVERREIRSANTNADADWGGWELIIHPTAIHWAPPVREFLRRAGVL